MYEQGIAKLGGKQHAMPDLPEGFSTMPSKERMAVITNLPTDGQEIAQAEFLPVKPGDMYELERVDSRIMWNRIRPA
jgi:hypothetical protein